MTVVVGWLCPARGAAGEVKEVLNIVIQQIAYFQDGAAQ
jgi:hypothetical protein